MSKDLLAQGTNLSPKMTRDLAASLATAGRTVAAPTPRVSLHVVGAWRGGVVLNKSGILTAKQPEL